MSDNVHHETVQFLRPQSKCPKRFRCPDGGLCLENIFPKSEVWKFDYDSSKNKMTYIMTKPYIRQMTPNDISVIGNNIKIG